MLNAEYHIKRILKKKFSQHIWNSMRATVTTNSMIYAKHNYSIRCISSNCRIMMKTFFRVFVKFAFQYTLHFVFKSTNVEIAFNFKLNLIFCQFYAYIYLLIFSKVIFNSNQIQKYQYDSLKKKSRTQKTILIWIKRINMMPFLLVWIFQFSDFEWLFALFS